MKFKGKEIIEITKQIAKEASEKKIGVRCTSAEAHYILDFIDSHTGFQVLFRPSYKKQYKYYVYFNRVNGKEK